MLAQKWTVECQRSVKGVERLVHPTCTGNDFFPSSCLSFDYGSRTVRVIDK
jgi:hypothetical protein